MTARLIARFIPRLLLGLAALIACASASALSAHDSRPGGVAWFEGEVDAAFASAEHDHKPVFLYWSAVWCPPCQELKATIFKRRDFLDRLSLFVPVYLDGDSRGAQIWAERFHVSGYPTVVVLRPDRIEIERISGGMDLANYGAMLDLALGEVRGAAELLEAISVKDTHPHAGTLSAHDCRQIAYNDWTGSEGWSKPDVLARWAALLSLAQAACPAGSAVEILRLQLLAAQAAVQAEETVIQGGKAPGQGTQDALRAVTRLIADPARAASVGDLLIGLPKDFFAALRLSESPDGIATARRDWLRVYDSLSTDTRYSAADHLYAWRARLAAAKALDGAGAVDPALAAGAQSLIDSGLAQEHEPYARASLVNAALNILELLGDDTKAGTLLAQEVRTAAHPYYYLADLAEIEEKRGATQAAVLHYAQSFQTAEGPATRVQWGAGYVRALLRLTPDDEAGIRSATLAVLGELDASGDLHGRNRRSIERLDKALRDWDAQHTHASVIAAAHERLQPVCARLAAEDPARPFCAGAFPVQH